MILIAGDKVVRPGLIAHFTRFDTKQETVGRFGRCRRGMRLAPTGAEGDIPNPVSRTSGAGHEPDVTMNVSDVMTRRVISISPETSIVVAIELMLKHHISGLPVIDNHAELVGILTEGDFLRRSEIETERKRSVWLDALLGPADAATDYVRSHGLAVEEVMTRDPITVTENTSVGEAVLLMENKNVKRLPVLRDGKLVGIISRANLMRALMSIHRAAPKSSDGDGAIRDRILADIGRQTWSAGASVDAVVHEGVADLWGTITDAAQRDALIVLVKNVPGVVKIEDHVNWKGQPANIS